MTQRQLFDLSGKTAMVTGASAGLGAHFASVLAQAGAEVIIAARRQAALEEVSARIAAEGGVARPLVLDVADQAAVSRAAAVFSSVDILVNNAGLVIEGAAMTHGASEWDTVVDTNLKAMFLMSQAVGQKMREKSSGSIINIASILGLRQAGGVVSYAVSKAGAIQLTKALALEWARFGIRVNALAPGYIETDLNSAFWTSEAGRNMIRRIPQHRLGRPQELDGPLLLLASDASSYMTGSVITADGGHLVSTL